MRRTVLVLMLALFVAPAAAKSPRQAGAHFVAAGELAEARGRHTATLLPDGRVLVAGGQAADTLIASIEIHEPRDSAFSAGGTLVAARTGHTATLLADGRVLFAGGYGARTSTEIYDPATRTSVASGNLASPQVGHTATLLRDGRVLIAGGLEGLSDRGVPIAARAELFDPATGRTEPAAPYATVNSSYPPGQGPIWPAATALDDGTVLLTGNAEAELYDPSAAAFRAIAPMTHPAYRFGMWGHTNTRLHDGSVLVAGGNDEFNRLISAERYDPATRSFTALPPMTAPRSSHAATLLQDGSVLLSGGEAQVTSGNRNTFAGSADSTERWVPALGRFVAGPTMRQRRALHTATALPDGSVLIVGGVEFAPYAGRDTAPSQTLATAERLVQRGACAKRYPNPCLDGE